MGYRNILTIILAILCLLPVNSVAEVPTPRLKPAPAQLSNHLVDSEARLFRSALRAAERRQWRSVESYRKRLTDPAARDVMIWIQAMKDPEISFSDLTYAVQNLGDWPRNIGIQAKAEYRMFEKPIGTQNTLHWFNGKEPVSGEGRAVLADAHYASGNQSGGDVWLKKAWREAKLSRDHQKTIYKRHKSRLTPDDHAARADYLVWEGSAHFSKVDGLLSLMPKTDRALMDARMRVLKNRSGMDAAIKRVPQSHINDTGLLYARAKWRRQKKTKAYALPVYLNVTSPPTTEKGQDRLWRERKLMTYWAIEERRYNEAYRLTRNHGMSRGAGFAEAEFLGGWLALTHLNKPDLATQHFQTLRQGVSLPVSLARANYWLGRAYESQGNGQSSTYYSEAAQFSNTFYGFLASEKLSPNNSMIILPPESRGAHLKAGFDQDPRIKAMKLLAEADSEHYYTVFSFHLDDEFESLDELSLLSQMSKQFGYMKPSVRAAKQASRLQSMLTESGYPMPEAILNLPDQFDKVLVLSIARQESEFNTSAVSSARAYGMMQMINATAYTTARKHRIKYSRSRMTSDSAYSAKLGALHLHDLLRDYDGSYILTAVAYNAGPTRVKQWIKTYGDPRTGEIDAIDWLESIPFSETRNYVQRVLENMQVYRARMNGDMARNRIYQDVTIGAF